MARASWSTYSVYKLFEVSAFVGVFALTIISSFSHASSLNIADLDCGGKLELETWRRGDVETWRRGDVGTREGWFTCSTS